MNTPLSKKLFKAWDLFRHLKLVDSIRVLFWSLLGQVVLIRVRLGGVSVFVRTRTSDLKVAYYALVDGEYDNIELPETRVILDGGANIGTSAIAFARKYPTATILAIEPEAENFAILKKNVGPWANIKTLNCALAAKNSERPLLNCGTGPWGFTITESSRATHQLGQTVVCASISSILRDFNIETVDILKLDIEGGEKELFENSEEWIGRVRLLVVELHDRILPGCTEAFNSSTESFSKKEMHGEKMIAIR